MKKVAHYRRTRWFSQDPETLGAVLKGALDAYPEDAAPSFPFTEGLDCVVARRSMNAEPYYLQFVTYEEGAAAAVIPAIADAAALDADTVDPPDGVEYIQAQLFCVVRGNDVVWTSHNSTLREGPINSLFAGLIRELLGGEGDTKFQLQAILDQAAFENVFKQGIGEIDLGVGTFKATLEALLSPDGINGFNLGALIAKPPTNEEIQAAANVMGKLVLRPGRRWDKPHVKELLSTMASNVMDQHDDEFVIVTKSGLRITKKKMSVHKEYDVIGNKQVLNPDDVHVKLSGILQDLDESNLLEE